PTLPGRRPQRRPAHDHQGRREEGEAMMSRLVTRGAYAAPLAGLLLFAALAHAAAPPVPPRDRHGHPLPEGALARLGTLRFRHTSPVSALAFSGDGKLLATGGEHLRLRFWSVSTAQELQGAPPTEGAVLAIAFSPDGKLLATGGSGGLLDLWELAS